MIDIIPLFFSSQMDINTSLAPILSSVIVSLSAIGLLWLQKKLGVKLDNHHKDLKQTLAMSSQGSV
jgi:hypothetical protein